MAYLVKSHDEFKEFCLNNNIKLRRKPELGKKYEAVFIEFRNLPHIKHVIYNCINKLNNEWSHTIVCGNANYELIKQIVTSFKIKIIKLDENVENVNSYNNLLLNVEFWRLFSGQKLLIYQEDTYLFHGEIKPFMEYDYVGAPWVKDHVEGGYGGNGGLSLRTRETMITCLCMAQPPPDKSFTRFDKMAEDLYFCNVIYQLKLGKIAHRKVAVLFSQEQLISNNPMGGHKFWDARDRYEFVDIPYKINNSISLEKTKIPRNFIQTFRENHIHKSVFENIQGILNKNKGFNYMLINDEMGIELIKKHFDKSVLDAFNKLRAGAAKGDFIRYIAMYIYGGMYLDMDAYIARDLSEFLNYDFVWIYDNSYNISQWFFMSSPKHFILKSIIDEMVIRINNNEQNIFVASGPTLVTDVIFGILNNEKYHRNNLDIVFKKELLQNNHRFMNGKLMLEDSRDIVFTFPGYTKEMLYDSSNPRYIPVFGGGKSPDLYK